MKIVLLDGNKIVNNKSLHRAFADALDLPEWYGENLDALYDMLTEITDETGVIAVNTELLADNLGRRWNAFLRLMEDIQKERTNFYFTVNPFDR